jgi:hypothetical protein
VSALQPSFPRSTEVIELLRAHDLRQRLRRRLARFFGAAA